MNNRNGIATKTAKNVFSHAKKKIKTGIIMYDTDKKINSLSNEKLFSFLMIFLLSIHIPDIGLIRCTTKDILDCFK